MVAAVGVWVKLSAPEKVWSPEMRLRPVMLWAKLRRPRQPHGLMELQLKPLVATDYSAGQRYPSPDTFR